MPGARGRHLGARQLLRHPVPRTEELRWPGRWSATVGRSDTRRSAAAGALAGATESTCFWDDIAAIQCRHFFRARCGAVVPLSVHGFLFTLSYLVHARARIPKRGGLSNRLLKRGARPPTPRPPNGLASRRNRISGTRRSVTVAKRETHLPRRTGISTSPPGRGPRTKFSLFPSATNRDPQAPPGAFGIFALAPHGAAE
jgi:hypothetical protein